MARFQFSHLYSSALTHELGTDDSTNLFLTQRRQDAILEGERQFCDLTECLIRQSSIACSNGVREYDLLANSTDFARMAPQGPEYRLVSSNSTASNSTRRTAGLDFPRTDIERLNRESPGWRDSTGTDLPESWYLRVDGGRVYIGLKTPPEIGSSEAGTLLVPYIAQPAQSTADTSAMFVVGGQERVDLRPYHPAIVHYAAHQLEKLRRDNEASEFQLQKFMGWVTRFIQAQRPRGGQRISLWRNYFREAGKTRRYDTFEAFST